MINFDSQPAIYNHKSNLRLFRPHDNSDFSENLFFQNSGKFINNDDFQTLRVSAST